MTFPHQPFHEVALRRRYNVCYVISNAHFSLPNSFISYSEYSQPYLVEAEQMILFNESLTAGMRQIVVAETPISDGRQ